MFKKIRNLFSFEFLQGMIKFDQFEAYHVKVQSLFFPMISKLGGSIEFLIA